MQAVEIEKLLQWTFRDELPKKFTSSAEGIWDRIADYGQHGGIDVGHEAAQRYPHFGLPHPDAEIIETMVNSLPDGEIDWEIEGGDILGSLTGLISVADLQPLPTTPKVTIGWMRKTGTWLHEQVSRPRQVSPVRPLRASALVVMHAGMGTRPDWHEAPPRPCPVPAARGPNHMVLGKCRGRNIYEPGSYCPIEWEPAPITVAEGRAEYLTWWRALDWLARMLRLEEHVALPPVAAQMPWRQCEPVVMIFAVRWPVYQARLPLHPQRETAGPPPNRRPTQAAAVSTLDVYFQTNHLTGPIP